MRLKLRSSLRIVATSIALATMIVMPIGATDVVKIGGISVLEGAFAGPGGDGIRGIELAIKEFDGMIAGKKIVLSIMSSSGAPDTAVNAARKLIEQDGVDIIVGPLSGSEGIAIRDFSKSNQGVTFINGSSAAQDATLRNGSENFFRFGGDGAQWLAGLGAYAYDTLGYKKVAVIAEDYSFPYTQILGFMTEYCRAGGHVPKKFWVPIGNKDYSSIVYAIPQDVDAVFVVLGGSDAVNFLTQYSRAGGDKPIIGGTITIDSTILDAKGPFKKLLIGTPSGTPTASENASPEWQSFVAQYRKEFPDGFSSPSLFAHHYYISTKAALLGLEKVKGDLSNNHAAYRKALSNLEFDTPTGLMKLDKNRNGIVDVLLTEVVDLGNGKLGNKVISVTKNVLQTMGEPEAEFLAMGPVSRDNPSCP